MYDRDDENQADEKTPESPEPRDESAPESAEDALEPAEEEAAGAAEVEPTGGETGEPEPAGPQSPTPAEPEVGEAQPEVVEEPELVELEEPPTEEELLRTRLDETSARLRAVSKAYTDLQSEMHAFRERMENQARFKGERQAFEQARAFFDPVQNLKRSVANTPEDSPVRAGLVMVLNQFMEALKRLGMEEVPGVGSPFDPKVHEALALQPVTDREQDGQILMVHADGYTVKGKVLHAAQVVVGKYQEPAGEA